MSVVRWIFCEVCSKSFPGTKADMFKHNLTWEHRSKLDSLHSGTKGPSRPVSAQGKQQQRAASGRTEDSPSVADTTTNSMSGSQFPTLLGGKAVEGFTGVYNQPSRAQRLPFFIQRPPPMPPGVPFPPPPPPSLPLPFPPQRLLFAGWPPVFIPPLFPPGNSPHTATHTGTGVSGSGDSVEPMETGPSFVEVQAQKSTASDGKVQSSSGTPRTTKSADTTLRTVPVTSVSTSLNRPHNPPNPFKGTRIPPLPKQAPLPKSPLPPLVSPAPSPNTPNKPTTKPLSTGPNKPTTKPLSTGPNKPTTKPLSTATTRPASILPAPSTATTNSSVVSKFSNTAKPTAKPSNPTAIPTAKFSTGAAKPFSTATPRPAAKPSTAVTKPSTTLARPSPTLTNHTSAPLGGKTGDNLPRPPTTPIPGAQEKNNGAVSSSEGTEISKSDKPTESVLIKKPPSMRIPKLSESARRQQRLADLDRAKRSPSIEWDDPLISDPIKETTQEKKVPSLSLSGPASVKRVGATASEKKNELTTQNQETELTITNKKKLPAAVIQGASGNRGVQKTGKKTKKKRLKEAMMRTVIRDTSPKFVPPEKPKKTLKARVGGSVESVQPMEVSHTGHTNIEQPPQPMEPCHSKPAHVDGVSSGPRPTHTVKPSSNPKQIEHESSGSRVQSAAEAAMRSIAIAFPTTTTKSTKTQPTFQPHKYPHSRLQDNQPPSRAPSFSSLPPKPYQVPSPARTQLSSSAPRRPQDLATALRKSSSGELAGGNSGSLTVGAVSRGPPSSPGFLRLPPSEARGESLLFGDVIEIEKESASERVGVPQETGQKKVEHTKTHRTIPSTAPKPSSVRGIPKQANVCAPKTHAQTKAQVSSALRDVSVSHSQQKTPVEGSSRESLHVTGTSSGGTEGMGQLQTVAKGVKKQLTRRYSTSLPESTNTSSAISPVSSVPPDHSQHSSSSAVSRTDSSAPATRKKSQKQHHLKLPLISPPVLPSTATSFTAVKDEPQSPTQSHCGPPLPHGSPSPPALPLDVSVLQQLQEKIDFETSKLKTMEIQPLPSSESSSGGSSVRDVKCSDMASKESPPLGSSGGESSASIANLPQPFQSGPQCTKMDQSRPLSSSLRGKKQVPTTVQRGQSASPGDVSCGSTSLSSASSKNLILLNLLSTVKPSRVVGGSEKKKVQVVSLSLDQGGSERGETSQSPSCATTLLNAVTEATSARSSAPTEDKMAFQSETSEAPNSRLNAGEKDSGQGQSLDSAQHSRPTNTSLVSGFGRKSTATRPGQPPEEKKTQRSTSPKLELIISSLKSSKKFDSAATEQKAENGSTSSTGSSSGEGKRKRKSVVRGDGGGVKRVRLVEGGSVSARERELGGGSPTQPSPSLESPMDGSGRGGMEGESEPENMSVSSSQHSSSREGDPALMTPHRKFASDIAALDKRDKELQEKLVEVQSQVEATSRHVQEIESHLVELTRSQRELALRRRELTEQYKSLLIEKQNLFTSPNKDAEEDPTATLVQENNFFEKMKELSDKEQDMQMRLLEGNQSLEEVSIKRDREEKKLEKLKSEKLRAVQSQFAMLKMEYKEVQRQKQEVLVSSWNILPTSPLSEQPKKEEKGGLPVNSSQLNPPHSSRPVEPASHQMEVETTQSLQQQLEEEEETQLEPMEGVSSLPLVLPPDHAAYTQYSGSAPLSSTPQEQNVGPPRTCLTPLTQQERLSSSHSLSGHAHTPNQQQNVSLNASVDSVLFPESVPDSQHLPSGQSDQQWPRETESNVSCIATSSTADSSTETTSAAAVVGSTRKSRGVVCGGGDIGDFREGVGRCDEAVIVKLEEENVCDYECEGLGNSAIGERGEFGDNGAIGDVSEDGENGEDGDDDGCSGSIRQAWMAAQALISHPLTSESGTSRDRPVEVGDDTCEDGEIGEGEIGEGVNSELDEGKVGEGVKCKLEEGEVGAGVKCELEEGEIGDGVKCELEEGEIGEGVKCKLEEGEVGAGVKCELEEGEIGEGVKSELEDLEIGDSLKSGPVEGEGVKSGPVEGEGVKSGPVEGEGVKSELEEGVGGEAGCSAVGDIEEGGEGARFVEYSPPHQNSVLGVKVSGGHIFSCSSDKSVKMYSVMGQQEESVFKKHRRSITCIEIFSCGDDVYIVSGSSDKHIIMYNIQSGEIEIDFSLGARVQCMFSQATLLVAGLSNGYVYLLNLQTKSSLGKWKVGEDPAKSEISCICIHRNTLLTACYDDKISCWDISDYSGGVATSSGLSRLHQITSFSMLVLCMQVEGELLYCGSADHTLQIFDTRTWERCGEVKGHKGAISGLCVSGNLLVTSCFDRLIRCFDTKDMDILQVYSITDLPFTLCCSGENVFCGLRNGKLISIKIDLSCYKQCKWGDCGLKFGIGEQLRLHLNEHLSCVEVGSTVRCKWRGCRKIVSVISEHVNLHLESSS